MGSTTLPSTEVVTWFLAAGGIDRGPHGFLPARHCVALGPKVNSRVLGSRSMPQLTAGYQQAAPAVPAACVLRPLGPCRAGQEARRTRMPSAQRGGQQVRNASQGHRSGQRAVPLVARPQAAGGPHGRGARQRTQQQLRHVRRRTRPLLPGTRRGGGNWLAGQRSNATEATPLEGPRPRGWHATAEHGPPVLARAGVGQTHRTRAACPRL